MTISAQKPSMKKPKLLKTDTTTTPEAEFEAARNEAFDACHQWARPDGTAYDLEPFSDGRDFLLWQLVEMDGGLDWDALRDAKGQKGNPMLFLHAAAKVLYLCSHQPEEWRHLRRDRAAFIEAIEEWASRYIPQAKHWEAVALGIKIINESTINQAIPRPGDSSQKPGN